MSNVMTTQAGDAGAFVNFDLSRVPSPCFVVDEVAIERNLQILHEIKAQSGAKILLALKAFSLFELAPLVMNYLEGTCASGVYEARLGRNRFGGEVTSFSVAYKQSDIAEIFELSNHVIFNSPSQLERFSSQQGAKIGLRINPQHSEGEIAKYDPSAPFSRLGTPISQIQPEIFEKISGVHIHNLCEQGFAPLARTWQAVEPMLAPYLEKLEWINLGGGHHITRQDYDRAGLVEFIKTLRAKYAIDVYLEPGEAIALDGGILVGEILDIHHNQRPLIISDISATCHMPDVIEAPYRPALLGEAGELTARIAGPSCLAGDVIGDYQFHRLPKIGDRIAFLDQAHYSMVKTNTFNGVPLPSIALWNSQTDKLKMVKEFGYSDFEGRLS